MDRQTLFPRIGTSASHANVSFVTCIRGSSLFETLSRASEHEGNDVCSWWWGVAGRGAAVCSPCGWSPAGDTSASTWLATWGPLKDAERRGGAYSGQVLEDYRTQGSKGWRESATPRHAQASGGAGPEGRQEEDKHPGPPHALPRAAPRRAMPRATDLPPCLSV